MNFTFSSRHFTWNKLERRITEIKVCRILVSLYVVKIVRERLEGVEGEGRGGGGGSWNINTRDCCSWRSKTLQRICLHFEGTLVKNTWEALLDQGATETHVAVKSAYFQHVLLGIQGALKLSLRLRAAGVWKPSSWIFSARLKVSGLMPGWRWIFKCRYPTSGLCKPILSRPKNKKRKF